MQFKSRLKIHIWQQISLKFLLGFCASADRQVFDSGDVEILKRIPSSLWSLYRSTRTCGASLTRDLGVKFGLRLALLGLSNFSENDGLNCRNFIMWFWRVLSSQLYQRVLSTLNFWYSGDNKIVLNRES